MKLFACQSCGNPLYFENTRCERCQHLTAYLPDLEMLSAVEPDGDRWIALVDPGKRYRFCANWELNACNWMVRTDAGTTLCRACQHNRTIPDLADPSRHALWQRIEEAKRRLETTSEPFEEIATSAGYDNAAFARRLFKRTTGMLPGDYRRMFRPIVELQS
jgi:hypothetical protein